MYDERELSAVARDQLMRAKLRRGEIDDPEAELFLELVDADLPVLADTPYLHAASWMGGVCDLLFTDGCGSWCAVEVKRAPAIYGTGSSRRTRKTKWNRKRDLLPRQAERALIAARRLHPEALVTAVALWLEGTVWRVLWEADSALLALGR